MEKENIFFSLLTDKSRKFQALAHICQDLENLKIFTANFTDNQIYDDLTEIALSQIVHNWKCLLEAYEN